jgi:hypothetical protein
MWKDEQQIEDIDLIQPSRVFGKKREDIKACVFELIKSIKKFNQIKFTLTPQWHVFENECEMNFVISVVKNIILEKKH